MAGHGEVFGKREIGEESESQYILCPHVACLIVTLVVIFFFPATFLYFTL